LPIIGPVITTLTSSTGLPLIVGAGTGAAVAPIITGLVKTHLYDPGDQWNPVLNILAGGAMASVAKMVPIPFVKKMAVGLLVGPAVMVIADLVRTHLLPALGLGDFVTVPYAGYGDFMTLPYAGYGDQSMIAAGELGDQASVEAGNLGSFGQDPATYYESHRTF
jgi:hypothetical protein